MWPGKSIITLPGHVNEVKGLQFIEACILSGGMDSSCRLYGAM